MRYEIVFEGGVTHSGDDLESRLDLVMERLVDAGATDPWIGLSQGTDGATVEITLSVDAASPEDALLEGVGLIKTVLRGSEGDPAVQIRKAALAATA